MIKSFFAVRQVLYLVIAIGIGWTLGARRQEDTEKSVRRFNEIYWQAGIPQFRTFWLGVGTQQTPTDLWTIQQILCDVRPEYIVETGTLNGGSALYHAAVLGQISPQSRIITIDIEPHVEQASRYPAFREFVEVWKGGATSPEILDRLSKKLQGRRTLVLLDSDHSLEHVSRELRLYAPFVSAGSYMIVHDTNLRGEGPPPVSGPLEAVRRFVASNPQFEIDRSRESLMLTLSSFGYLKKVRD